MSGFELFVILIIIANVLAAVLKKRTQSKRQIPNPQNRNGDFEPNQNGRQYPDFDDDEMNEPSREAGRLEEIKHEASSLEARAGLEGEPVPKTVVAAVPRKKSAALEVVDFSRRRPRILGLQSKSDLRRAFLLSEVLGQPRSLSQD